MTVMQMLSNTNYAKMECRVIDIKGKVLSESEIVKVEGKDDKQKIFTVGQAVKKYGKKQLLKSHKEDQVLVVKIGK